MEIIMNFLNSLTSTEIIYLSSTAAVLVLIMVYRGVIAPKIRHRKLLKRIRQAKYKKAQRKIVRDSSFTWGDDIDRTNINTSYVVEEFTGSMDSQYNKIMNKHSEES